MTKFKTSLLTAAVVGALALPSLASAATLLYPADKQITFAKDLIVNNDTTIYVPGDLTLAAQPGDLANMQTVLDNQEVRVKVTLTDGAKFDSTADATTLVKAFLIGAQLGGVAAGTAIGDTTANLVGTPYYSASGQELNFTFKAIDSDTVATGTVVGNAATGAFALKLNSMQITSLVQGLQTGSSVGAEITAQNQAGQQILAAKQTIALSKWGIVYNSLAQANAFNDYKIDVVGGGTGTGAFNRKTRFSPNGNVGNAAAAAPNNVLWGAGGVTVDIAKANRTNATGGMTGAETYINNYSAVAAQPQFNVVSTGTVNIKVIGTDLTSFAAVTAAGVTTQNLFLSTAADCSAAVTGTGTAATIVGGTATFAIPASHASVLGSIGAASPSALNYTVCFRANGAKEMVAQALKGEVGVAYNLSTQRVDPPTGTFTLKPLVQNGTNIVFQNVNPAGNATAQSFLRVTNNNAFACPIVIDAKDDAGKHSGEVKFTLAGHESKQVNSEVLEGKATSAGVTGSFGDGTGKWYVRVTAECDFVAGSALNRHQDGVVTDLTSAKNESWLTPDVKL